MEVLELIAEAKVLATRKITRVPKKCVRALQQAQEKVRYALLLSWMAEQVS